jgi:hypothetical protein
MASHTKTTDIPTDVGYQAYKSTNSGASWATNGPPGIERVADIQIVTTGVSIPGFHKKVKRGELLPYTPFNQSHYTLSGETGLYTLAKQGGTWYKRVGPWVPYKSFLTQSVLSSALDAVVSNIDVGPAVQACAAKIYSSGHDTLTSLLELHKTAALFRDLSGKFVGLFSASKAAGNWLEYRYGWRILYFELLDLQKALSSLDERRTRFSDRVGFSQHITNSSSSVLNTGGGTYYPMDFMDTIEVSTRGAITADINPPKFRFNPVTTGWELVRFSFIVDWFIQIGQWLEALSFLALVSDYTAAGGTYASITREATSSGAYFTSPTTYLDVEVAHMTAKLTITTRTPQLVAIHPFASIKLDVGKVLDLAALFYGGVTKSPFRRTLRL